MTATLEVPRRQLVIPDEDRIELEAIKGLDTYRPLDWHRILGPLDPSDPQWQEKAYARFKHALDIAPMVKGLAQIIGKPRQGKTSFLMMLLWRLGEYFGQGTVMNFHPLPPFGEYTLLTPEFLKEELEMLTNVIYSTSRAHRVFAADETARNKSHLLGKSVAVDEAHKWFGRRRGNTNLALHTGDIIKEWGHYDILMLLLSQSKAELDALYVDEYVTHDIEVWKDRDYPDHFSWINIFDRQRQTTKRWHFYRPHWYRLFKHNAMVRPRPSYTFRIDDRPPEQKAEEEERRNRRKQ